MAIILIAACAGTRQVIGDHGQLPWHFPSDLKFFKQTTLDQTLLMGRTTYDSIITQFGRPLPRRRILVVSRDPAFRPDGVEVFANLESALEAAPAGQDIFVAGGAQIYTQTLSLADKIFLTHIDRDIPGDAFFPALDPAIWHCSAENKLIENDNTLRFCTYEKRLT